MCVPLHLEKDIAQKGQLHIWHVTEDISTISDSFRNRAEKTKSGKRQTELIGEYHLTEHTNLIGKVRYLENGKPVLEEGFITISHDLKLVGYYISSEPVGMDIQRPTEQLERIKHKFCNEAELAALDQSPTRLRDLTLIWSAKEAIFKIYGENVPFAEGMHITFEGPSLLCLMTSGKIHKLEFFELDGSLVVYSVS